MNGIQLSLSRPHSSHSQQVFWLLVGMLTFNVIMPVVVWVQTTGNPVMYFEYSVPVGQLSYILSKLFGLYAVAFLSTQVVIALMMGGQSKQKLQKEVQAFELFPLHRILGFLCLTALLLHGGLFVLATSLRVGHTTFHWLIPEFTKGYYVLGVSLGAAALWIMVLVVFAGVQRAKGKDAWRYVHHLAVVGYVAVIVHSFMIGSETRYLSVKLFYGVALVTTSYALFKRIQRHVSSKQ